MNTVQTKYNLKIGIAKDSDWNVTYEILKDAGLHIYLFGTDKPVNFYLIKDTIADEIIGCFRIDPGTKDVKHIGIVKSLAFWKRLTGKGLGTYIANNVIPELSKELGYKTLYLHSVLSSFKFWNEKTNFKHIKTKDIKEKCIINYVNFLQEAIPEDFYAIFYWELESGFLP